MRSTEFDKAVARRWSELAAEAARLWRRDPAASVSTPRPPEAWRAIYRLEAEIARSEHPSVAEYAVTAWMIEKLPIEECVRLERAAHPRSRPRMQRGPREATDVERWHTRARAAVFREVEHAATRQCED